MRRSLAWIGRLQAEEAIEQVKRTGVGTGSAGEFGTAIYRQWLAQAHPNHGPAQTVEERQVAVKRAGIKVFKASTA